MKDLKAMLALVEAAAFATGSDSLTPVTVDLQGFGSVVFALVVGAGTYADDAYVGPVLEESDNGSDWADVASTHYSGSLAAVVSTLEANQVRKIGYIGHKRYVRCTLEVTGTLAADVILGVLAIKGHPQHAPVA